MAGSFKYLSLADVIALHEFIMGKLGHSPNLLRDEGVLDSAIMKPQWAAHYENADIIRQAAILAVGISQAQAFIDGNKRTAYIACIVFLGMNGFHYSGDPIEMAQKLEAVTEPSIELSKATIDFTEWLGEHIISRS